MARLSDLTVTSMAEILPNSNSLCESLAKKLNVEQGGVAKLTRTPKEVVDATLNSQGVNLTMHERRSLPNLILMSSFDQYQNKFALEVLNNFSTSDRFWRRLFRSWLLEYNLNAPAAAIVIDRLEQNMSKLPFSLQNIANKYPLLSLTPNFSDAAQNLLNGKMSKEDRLALGLSNIGNALTGPADEILKCCINILISNSSSIDQIEGFKILVAPSGIIHQSVRMYAMVGLILSVSEQPANEKISKDISNLIEKNFDDPRTDNSSWPPVPPILGGMQTRNKCIEVAKKWRVFRSITLFFSIIDQVVGSEHKHHFPLRRQFWLSYFDKGLVTDAWVILGSKARDRMTLLRNQKVEEYSSLSWSSLRGAHSDQCALLIQLGNTTVMEFSHSGRARIWGAKDRSRSNIPRLYRDSYDASELRAECPEEQMFRHDANGRWRVKTQQCIQRLAGGSNKL